MPETVPAAGSGCHRRRPGSGGRGRTRSGSRRVQAGSGASAVLAAGFEPPEPPVPAHSVGKFCGLHRERREGREGKRRAARGSGSPATSQGCGDRDRGKRLRPPVRVPSARALEPGARRVTRSSLWGSRESERSSPHNEAARPALQNLRGTLDTWCPKENIPRGKADPGALAGVGFTRVESCPAALSFPRTKKGPQGGSVQLEVWGSCCGRTAAYSLYLGIPLPEKERNL